MKRLVQAAGLLLAVGSCESTTGPANAGNSFPAGDTVTISLAPNDATHTYVMRIGPHDAYMLYAISLRGSTTFLFTDSAGQRAPFGPTTSFQQSPTTLLQRPLTGLDGRTMSGTFTVQLLSYPADSSSQVRFFLYKVNPLPETRDGLFAVGDTVGETISPSADVDTWTAQAQAGQRVIAVLQQMSGSSTGDAQLVVTDPAGTLRGYAEVSSQGPVATTGPIASGSLPVDGTYTFAVSGVPGFANAATFQGGYRFWTYVVNPAPEHAAAAAPFDTVISTEKIDKAGDVDEFTFTATAGMMMEGYIQAARGARLDLLPSGGAVAATATSFPGDTSQLGQNTGRFQVPSAGPWIARVSGLSPGLVGDTGSYRLYLYRVNISPEHVSAGIIAGDTVSGESIDAGGDIDDFTFNVTAGETYAVFLQSLGASTHVQLDAIDASGPSVLRSVISNGDTGLYGQSTGVFRVNATGTQRLRVYGTDDQTTGPYRFVVRRMNRKPEVAPDTIALGDSVITESLAPPGDTDEFRFSIPLGDSDGVNLVMSGALAEIENTGTLQIVGSTQFGGGQTGPLRLPHNNYVARVFTYSQGSERQPYRMRLYHFSYGPEAVPDSFAVGDTVQEAIDVPGDADNFRFFGRRGQHVTLMLQGLTSSDSNTFYASIPLLGTTVLSTGAASALADHQSMRLDLPQTGMYTVGITGFGTTVGAYRFTIQPLPSAPEHGPATLNVGDSVTNESIDFPGDWDDFQASATPGTELALVVSGNDPCCVYPTMMVFDSVTGDTLAATSPQGMQEAGPFHVPASGKITVSVFQYAYTNRFCSDATCGGWFGYTGGPYAIRLLPVNRAPEHASAGIVLNDTVSTEDLTLADIDEFTGTGTPGDTLSLWWRLRANSSPPGTLVGMQVIDPATGNVLAGGPGPYLNTSNAAFTTAGSFSVPASGSYLVRVFTSGTQFYGLGGQTGSAPYEFLVKRGP